MWGVFTFYYVFIFLSLYTVLIPGSDQSLQATGTTVVLLLQNPDVHVSLRVLYTHLLLYVSIIPYGIIRTRILDRVQGNHTGVKKEV